MFSVFVSAIPAKLNFKNSGWIENRTDVTNAAMSPAKCLVIKKMGIIVRQTKIIGM